MDSKIPRPRHAPAGPVTLERIGPDAWQAVGLDGFRWNVCACARQAAYCSRTGMQRTVVRAITFDKGEWRDCTPAELDHCTAHPANHEHTHRPGLVRVTADVR
jgi:hypothetical protein